MGKILTTEDADQTVTDVCWHLEHESWDDDAARVRALRESNEALRDLLREVLIEWRNGRACGCERCKDLIARASEAVDAAVEAGKP